MKYLQMYISPSNKKLGQIWNLSTLPGNKPLFIKKSGKYLFEDQKIVGFCPDSCPYINGLCYGQCYTKMFKKQCAEPYKTNTILLRDDEKVFFDTIQSFLNSEKYIKTGNKNALKKYIYRHDTVGDLKSVRDIKYLSDICKRNSDITIYLYTHHEFIFDDELYNQIPDNLIINVSLSDYMSEDIKKRFPKYNQFVVTTSDKIPKNGIRCPSCSTNRPKNSIKCANCCRCFTKTASGNGRITYELIRV